MLLNKMGASIFLRYNKNMSKRNSLLEITRLLAALWVMYYHGFSLITKTACFSNGYLAVDYFFILTGFFFLSSFKKFSQNNDSIFKGLFKFLWSRFKGLAITFSICFVFSIFYYIQYFENIFNPSIFGYLWYVPQSLVVLGMYYILKTIIKNENLFNIVTSVLVAITLVITLTAVSNYGILRGIAGIGIGILISQIPKLNFKNSNLISFLIFTILLATMVIVSIYLFDRRIEAPICIIALFPSIIYFANNVNFSNKIINSVCKLSFGLYAYQSVFKLLRENSVISNPKLMFLFIVLLAIGDLLIESLVKYLKSCHSVYLKKKQI